MVMATTWFSMRIWKALGFSMRIWKTQQLAKHRHFVFYNFPMILYHPRKDLGKDPGNPERIPERMPNGFPETHPVSKKTKLLLETN